VVDEVRFLARGGVPDVRDELAAVAALAVRRELRDRDRGENADDGDDDEKLDQGEAFAPLPILDDSTHPIPPSVCVTRSVRVGSGTWCKTGARE
jgi:hypothetical protein